jgi:hypothetical protein
MPEPELEANAKMRHFRGSLMRHLSVTHLARLVNDEAPVRPFSPITHGRGQSVLRGKKVREIEDAMRASQFPNPTLRLFVVDDADPIRGIGRAKPVGI